jgi:hypothetical protein|tara:strand:+ start:884 stop:1129 length:246 start_codon:yes stop_codon:yes gene_type:complete
MKNTYRDGNGKIYNAKLKIADTLDYLSAMKKDLLRLEQELLRLERAVQNKNGQATEKEKFEIKYTKLLILTIKNTISEVIK